MTRTSIGSDVARAWVRTLRLGNPYAKSILMALANYVNEGGTAYPGIATLHNDTEIAENTIVSRLRWCEDIGAVILSKCWVDENGRRNREGRGRPTSTEVRFLVDADVDAINESARLHTADRPLRGAAKQHAASPPNDETEPETSPCPGEEQSSVSPSLAPQQPLTGAARIYEEEKERKKESKTHTQTLSREEAEKGFEEKIDEEFEKDFEQLKSGYPQGILDLESARSEFVKIASGDRKNCLRALPVYADRLRGRGRGRAQFTERSMKAHIFIRKRCWEGLLASETKADAPTQHSPNSPEGRALLMLGRIMRYRPFQLVNGNIVFTGKITAQLLALANAPPESEWRPHKLGSGNFASWRNLGLSTFVGCALPALTEISAPWSWPPRKDGSIITTSTGPPGTLSDEDARALSGM